MKKMLVIFLFLLLFFSLAACKSNDSIEVESTIIRKEILQGNQHYIYVEYPLEGMEGLFEASIKLRNRTEYDRYDVGDTYRFSRPAPKQ